MSDRPLVAPRDDLQALEAYHSPQVAVPVRLNTNESPYPPPPAFVEAWLDAVARVPLHRYPDRSVYELRAALADHLGVSAEQVFCANGSNEVLQTLLLTFGGSGRRALTFEPTYALHAHIARVSGTQVETGERDADFCLDADAAATRARDADAAVTLLCSPNNPTGVVDPLATIEMVAAATNGLVVIDEAYGEFAPESATGLVTDDGRVVVVRTYSKVWSMAALRLGFCIAPASIVRELEKVVLPYHLSAPTQLAGVTALRFRDEMRARVDALVRERERLVAELSRIPGLTTYPSGANFVLVRAAGDGHVLWQALLDRGVLVRDFSRWPRLDDCLRITVGTPQENDACLAALREATEEVAA